LTGIGILRSPVESGAAETAAGYAVWEDQRDVHLLEPVASRYALAGPAFVHLYLVLADERETRIVALVEAAGEREAVVHPFDQAATYMLGYSPVMVAAEGELGPPAGEP